MSSTVTLDSQDADDSRPDDARRAKVRRFGLALLLFVVLLVGLTVGYVLLFDRVLRDPNLPPTVTGPANRRVSMFELVVAALVAAGATAWIARRSRRSP